VRFDDVLSLWQQILEQEVVGHKPSNIIKEYKQIREYLNEEAKKENGIKISDLVGKSQKKTRKSV
jgi:hypothetical protein|tara:strand:- start:961 stop:1155 length:195 start_codon:yes stop_codon:yes gene_type:complete